MTKTVRRVILATLLGAAAMLVLGLQLDQAAVAAKDSQRASKPRVFKAPQRTALKWDDGAGQRSRSPRAFCAPGNPTTAPNPYRLVHDQLGATTLGIGPSSYVNSMQHLVHFGGAAQTTQLCQAGPPFTRPIALSWSIFTCTQLPCPPRVPASGLMTTQRVNIWSAVYNGVNFRYEPAARIFQTPLVSTGTPPTANTVNEFVCKTFTGAPAFNPANSHLFAGVGAVGPNSFPGDGRIWALAGEPVNPDAHREWVGSGGTQAVTMGPTTFSTAVYPGGVDLGIRLTLDGTCVPVELERFDAEAG